ncbi:CoA-binding protein [Zavarzinella formosa]|uniref:CoA-binding protein n=1 Tax=Zavarzinella formosa TaxID=360055 RepID=UPI0003033AE1|nr:CoA-binding protein [Zavarzinella formosa]
MPTIAVLGASSDRRKFGNKCVRAYLSRHYTVYPVNPKDAEVEGLPAYRTIADVPPGRLDRVSVYLSPSVGLGVLPELARREVGEVWLNPGTVSPEILALGQQLGLNLVTACSIVDIGISPSELPE